MHSVSRNMTRSRKTFYHALPDVQDVRVKRQRHEVKDTNSERFQITRLSDLIKSNRDKYNVVAKPKRRKIKTRSLSVRDAKSERFEEAGLGNLTENETDVYRMDATPKGICVIINNRNFTDERLSRRDGTDEDKNKMKDFFRRHRFEVRIFENQTDSEMLEELKLISEENHRSYNCFVCFILSHGEHGSVYGNNGKFVSVEEIKHFFYAESCTSLANKPKLFFVQASQGSRPVYEGPDFLTVFDTTPDFISTLIEVLDRNPGISLLDIITMVTKKMDEVTDLKQIPMFRSTLKKQIILY